MPQSDTKETKLVRGLSLSDSILLLAGGIIGSGIFLTAKDVALNTRKPWLFLFVWVIGMGMALLACFAFAELGSMFPSAGGQYVYMREAYGDAAGFLYGWMYFTVSATGTVAALGVGFATYLGQTFPALRVEQVVFPLRFVDVTRGHLIALAAIALQTLINIFGVKKGAILQNVATWAKFGAIAIFVFGGLALGRGSWDHFRYALPAGSDSASFVTGIGIALIAVFWAYDGWVYVTFVAGEVKDPQRNLPRALIWGMLLVGAVYISINAVYVYALPMKEIAAQEAVAQTAAVSMFSGRVAPWLSLMVALSCFGAMAPMPDERRSRLLRHGGRRYLFSFAGQSASALAHAGDEPGTAIHMVRRAGAQRKIRRAFYLRDVHDGAELRFDRRRFIRAPAQTARHTAPLPLHRISVGSGDLYSSGQLMGGQRCD